MSVSPQSQSAQVNEPFIIGVAGGTGSGKTTVVKNLIKVLHEQSVLCISHDNYYKDQSDLAMADRLQTNYDHPQALETELLVKHLQELRAGRDVQQPTYDFSQHTRAATTVTLRPARVIIIEGILIFEAEELRQQMQLKIFVDTDADTRLMRKIKRDMLERGRELDYILHQYDAQAKPMHHQFVEPSKRFADVILPEGGENHVALDLLLTKLLSVLNL